MKKFTFILFSICIGFQASSQCVSNAANIYTYTDALTTYEIVKERKNWQAALLCARARGGELASIETQIEQDTLFSRLQMASINNLNTIAPDGGGASYVWLAGNDRQTEGVWRWEMGLSTNFQFWQGTGATGSSVGSLFNNWGSSSFGSEPDNFQNQDAVGLALTNWPLGIAGQWNDIDESNQLYFVIEIQNGMALQEQFKSSNLKLYPNPANNYLQLEIPAIKTANMIIFDAQGKKMMVEKWETGKSIDISELPSGSYFIHIEGERAFRFIK